MATANSSLNIISFQEAILNYNSLNLAEERRQSKGTNDFELLEKLLPSFDVTFADKENLPPNVQVISLFTFNIPWWFQYISNSVLINPMETHFANSNLMKNSDN